jgi:hypothetical protein
MLKKISGIPEDVLLLLRALIKAGGSIYWTDGAEPPLPGIDEAVRLGLVERDDGGGWSVNEGVTITAAGREAHSLRN